MENKTKTEKNKKFWSLKKMLIYGDPWQGKTMLAVVLSAKYNRIYWNVKIYKNKKQVVKQIEKMSDIEAIERNEERWLLILDEVSVNANSKDVRATDNRILIEESVFLQRKKNIDVYYLGQQLESFDIGLRRGQNVLVFECWWNQHPKYPKFLILRVLTNKKGEKIGTVAQFYIDLIKIMKNNRIEYNTLETSKLKKTDKKNKK